MTAPIQWYPGHIARAYKDLQEHLKRVDLVFVVLDARIPRSSQHPELLKLIGERERVVVLNKSDLIPPGALRVWQQALEAAHPLVIVTNAQQGDGVRALLKASRSAQERVNARRARRGILPRPVRAAVVGFPNVGKSALINRLVGKRAAASAPRPGVTRQVRWIRISEEIELLDSPGILPMRLEDQVAAVKLAICDDIGEASYNREHVAGALFDLLVCLIPDQLQERYGLDPAGLTGEAWLALMADHQHHGLSLKAAEQLLLDYRRGYLGAVALELPLEY